MHLLAGDEGRVGLSYPVIPWVFCAEVKGGQTLVTYTGMTLISL